MIVDRAKRDMAMGNAPLRPTIGVAVILTNDYVGCPDCTELLGTREDHRTWKRALGDLLFDVRSYCNLSKVETIRLLEHVSTLEMSATSGDVKQHLVFVYSGHGQKDYIVCQDGQSLSTDDVCEPFLQHRCGTGVAKLFFFDACRGEKRDKGRVYARSASVPGRVADRGGTIAQGELMPSEGNYLVVFSTLPDYIAQELFSFSGSPPHGMWSQMFAPNLATCNKPLTSLIADVNWKMVCECRRLLSLPVSQQGATFQVAETSRGSLIGDVNLFACAAQLASQMLVRAPQVPAVIPPQPPRGPAPSSVNYRQKFNNDFRQRYQLKPVVEIPLQEQGAHTFRLQVWWEGVWYTEQSQPCHTKEEAKEEACRLMVERLEGLIRERNHPAAPPMAPPCSHSPAPPMAPPCSHSPAPPMAPPSSHSSASMGHCVTEPISQAVMYPPMPRPPAAQVVVSRGANKKCQELLNECRQKVENAGGRWSLTGEPENVAQNTFQCQLTLDVTPSKGAAPLHFVSELVQVVGRKHESKERAAKDLVHQLHRCGVIKLN